MKIKRAPLQCLLAVQLFGCGADFSDLPDSPQSFFSSRIDSLRVPEDYDAPNDGVLTLDYQAYRTVDVLNGERRAPKGILVFHFGGPGAQNALTLTNFMNLQSEEVFRQFIDDYVVVALDEIGVSRGLAFDGTSTPVNLDCRETYSVAGLDQEALLEEASDYVSECEDEFDLLDQMNTVRSARDLETLRRTLQYDTVSFYGFSYGAHVALAYAALYPDTTGLLILDSPLDPGRPLLDRFIEQGRGFEAGLDRFLAWCDSVDEETCPFGDGDAVGDFSAWLEELPETGDGDTREDLIRTTLDELFAEQRWPFLGRRLAAIRSGDSTFSIASDALNSDAFYATTCGDAQDPTEKELEAFRATLLADAPRFGPLIVGDPVPCLFLENDEEETRIEWTETFASLPPVLITGNVNDPITPPDWAENLHGAIPGSVRITIPDASHSTGLQGDNMCQDQALLDALFGSGLPTVDVACASDL